MNRSTFVAPVLGLTLVLVPVAGRYVVEHPLPPRAGERAAPIATVETLFDVTFPDDTLPHDAAHVALYRSSLGPGERLDYPSSLPAVSVSVDRVEEGFFGIRSHGPVLVTREGGPELWLGPGDDANIVPGDSVARFENAAPRTMRNLDETPLRLVGAGVYSLAESDAAMPEPPTGYAFEEIGNLSPVTVEALGLTGGPLRLMLERVTLPPGAEIAPYHPTAPELLFVEQGELALDVAPEGGAFNEGETLRLRPGTPVSWAPALATSNRRLRNDGDAPLTLLHLVVSPIGPRAA